MKNIRRTLSLFLLFTAVLGFTNFLLAQSASDSSKSNMIREIELKGLRFIDENLIYFNIESEINSPLNPRTVSQDIKRIFALGYFTDVKVDISYKEDNELILAFIFTEKPTIREILFEGNTRLSDKVLTEKISILPFQILDERKIRQDIETIRREYRAKTFYNISVTYKTEVINELYSRLTFVINENQRTYLTDIHIEVEGKKPEFYPLDLERRMISSEVDCFTWLNSTGIYEEARINQDLTVITRAYYERGYIRVFIDRPDIRLIHNPEFSRVEVKMKVTEGDQYFVGDITFESLDGKEFLSTEEEMKDLMLLKTGNIYNPLLNGQSRVAIGDIYQTRGYAFSFVRISENVDDETKKVDLKISIFRGEKVYINRINVKGNNSTHDEVVRRELTIFDNELYNGVKIRESQANLEGLGFFIPSTGVSFQRNEIRERNEVDYNIALNEAQTGTLRGALTFSNQSGIGLNGEVSKRNFRGYGQTISISASLNVSNNQSAAIRFTEPYFLDTRITSTSSLNYRFTDGSDFDTRSRGFSQGFSYPIWKNWSVSSTYLWSISEYEDINEDGEETLDGETTSLLSALRFGLSYYTVNNPQVPSNGVNSRLFYTEAGGGLLGGTELFREIDFTYQYFKSLSQDSRVVFMTKYNFSRLFSKEGEKVPTGRRYRLGGARDLRGFDFDDVEGATSPSEYSSSFDPSDLEDNDPDLYRFYLQNRGGTIQHLLNVELLFPLTREGFVVRGVVFYDIGNVWQDNKSIYDLTGADQDFSEFRSSYGFGIRIITGGLGVLRFEYGTKIDQKKGESGGKFHFTIGTLF